MDLECAAQPNPESGFPGMAIRRSALGCTINKSSIPATTHRIHYESMITGDGIESFGPLLCLDMANSLFAKKEFAVFD